MIMDMIMSLSIRNTKSFKYLKKILLSLSILLNVILGGRANQTFSARNYAWKKANKPNICWLIDLIFFYDPNHCMMSWLYWHTRKDIRLIAKGDLQTVEETVVLLYDNGEYDDKRYKEGYPYRL